MKKIVRVTEIVNGKISDYVFQNQGSSLGDKVHILMQNFFNFLGKENITKEDMYLSQQYQDLFLDLHSQEVLDTFLKIFNQVKKIIEKHGELEIIGTELELEHELEDMIVVGHMDLVFKSQKELIIIDYKTGYANKLPDFLGQIGGYYWLLEKNGYGTGKYGYIAGEHEIKTHGLLSCKAEFEKCIKKFRAKKDIKNLDLESSLEAQILEQKKNVDFLKLELELAEKELKNMFKGLKRANYLGNKIDVKYVIVNATDKFEIKKGVLEEFKEVIKDWSKYVEVKEGKVSGHYKIIKKGGNFEN